ncbi:MAG: prolyl oligopeptidase family serine peptidase [Candidatus Marinimicrobia bacterium]|nr:prolyl oligopeptidase family serine peptidase [Candidatus Neomarinimicrobiota bacterium]
MIIKSIIRTILSFHLLGFTIAYGSDSLTVAKIMAIPSISGERARISSISPDGSRLLYFIDESGNHDWELFLANTKTGESETVEGIPGSAKNISWHTDGNRLLYTSEEDIHIFDLSKRESNQLTKTPGIESSVSWTNDGNGILYRYDKSYRILPLDGGAYIQITEKPDENEADYEGTLSPDGTRFLFKRVSESDHWEMHWADYLPETVEPKSSKRGVGSGKIGLVEVDGNAEVKWIKPPWEEKYRIFQFRWSDDSNMLYAHLVSVDFHTRKIFVYRLKEKIWKEVWEEKDDKWIGGPRLTALWSPSGKNLLISSEKDGWNHLYLNETNKKKNKRLTKGKWEVQEFEWLSDEELFFASNEEELSERHFYLLNVKEKKRRKLNTERGYNSGAELSDDRSTVVYFHDNQGQPPEIYALSLEEGAVPVQITNTVPEDYADHNWTIPEIVEFKSHVDGKNIRANLYKPQEFQPGKEYPTIIFVHGAGYRQNVTKGWTHYWREFMFHTVLNRRGYVVMDVDYRGSAGYGRNWRTDVYMHLGGLDLDDIVSGVKWGMDEGFIDEERIGIYGGSYGGFMAIMALAKEPELFAAGAGLRSVTDWVNYYYSNPFYTAKRLGLPEENKEAYERSSPIHFIDNLKSPLLLLHGVLDANVQFQDAVQLVQKLIDGGKDFELMIYPKEAHSFKTAEAWTDEYTRILNFMEIHVRNK